MTFANDTGDGDVEAGGARMGDGSGIKFEECGADEGTGGGRGDGKDQARHCGEVQTDAADAIGSGASGECAEEAENSTSLSGEQARAEDQDVGGGGDRGGEGLDAV